MLAPTLDALFSWKLWGANDRDSARKALAEMPFFEAMNLGIQHFEMFLLSALVLNLTPGQDTLYIIGRSLAQGRIVGIASGLGISTGSLCHTVAAALGLSAILATAPMLFLAVKLVGAAYLIYLGVRLFFAKASAADTLLADSAAGGWAAAYRQGILTNVLNPKVALFFLAFVPQFIAPDAPSKPAAFLILGLTFITTGTLWGLVLAFFAAPIGARLRQRSEASRWLNRLAGGLFVALGIRMVVTR